MNPDSKHRSAAVKGAAAQLGFDACGIAAADNVDPQDRLGAWLAQGYHADMKWLERNKEVRQDIRLRLPGAQSVIVVARSYNCGADVPPAQFHAGYVARYARGNDYHQVLAKPLKTLADQIGQLAEGVRCYCSIDTGPVLERAWAQRAGIGWIGKNGLVIHPVLGSWFFLGVIATTLELQPDPPAQDKCASCTRCLDACPTGALVQPRVMDARRCISYLTIEHRGPIPQDIAQKIGNRIFGCDTCQEACPWNQNAQTTNEPHFHQRHAEIDLNELLALDEQTFKTKFKNTPILRATLNTLQKNATTLTAK